MRFSAGLTLSLLISHSKLGPAGGFRGQNGNGVSVLCPRLCSVTTSGLSRWYGNVDMTRPWRFIIQRYVKMLVISVCDTMLASCMSG